MVIQIPFRGSNLACGGKGLVCDPSTRTEESVTENMVRTPIFARVNAPDNRISMSHLFWTTATPPTLFYALLEYGECPAGYTVGGAYTASQNFWHVRMLWNSLCLKRAVSFRNRQSYWWTGSAITSLRLCCFRWPRIIASGQLKQPQKAQKISFSCLNSVSQQHCISSWTPQGTIEMLAHSFMMVALNAC